MTNNFSFVEAELDSDTRLITNIFQSAELEIIDSIKGKNLWRDSDRLQMLKQIKTILKDCEAQSVSQIEPLIAQYYEKGGQSVEDIVGKKGVFQLIDKDALSFVVASLPEIQSGFQEEIRSLMSNSFSNIASSLNLVKKELRSDILGEIGKAQIIGKSRDKLAQELVNKLENDGITGFKIPDPTTNSGERNYSLKAYVHGLTQSTLINSRASATIQRAIELGQDLLKISSHSKPSPMCQMWQGKIVSITGSNTKYPKLSDAQVKGYKRGGIFHRYCRHSLTVFIESNVVFK